MIFIQHSLHHTSSLWSHSVCLLPAISAFALAALVLPGSYPDYLDLIRSLSVGTFLIGLAKFGIAFPVSFHTYNGIRHLVSVNNLIRRGTCFCLHLWSLVVSNAHLSSLFSPPFPSTLLLFKSVLGYWQGLQNPRGLPHRLHSYWPVHHHLPRCGFPLSAGREEMSREEKKRKRAKGNDVKVDFWELCVYMCCSGPPQALCHQSIK